MSCNFLQYTTLHMPLHSNIIWNSGRTLRPHPSASFSSPLSADGPSLTKRIWKPGNNHRPHPIASFSPACQQKAIGSCFFPVPPFSPTCRHKAIVSYVFPVPPIYCTHGSRRPCAGAGSATTVVHYVECLVFEQVLQGCVSVLLLE